MSAWVQPGSSGDCLGSQSREKRDKSPGNCRHLGLWASICPGPPSGGGFAVSEGIWTRHLDYKSEREKKEYPIFEYCGRYYCQMSSNIDTIKLYVTLKIRWAAINCVPLFHLLDRYICSLGHAPDVQLFNVYYPVKQIDSNVCNKVGWFRPELGRQIGPISR